MASLRKRVQADGTISYQVRFYEKKTGERRSLTYSDRVEAARIQTMLDVSGGDLSATAAMIDASRRSMPDVLTVVLQHIDHLDGVSPGQVSKYRQYVRDHMDGFFGLTPIDELNYMMVTAWGRSLAVKKLAAKTVNSIHGLLSSAMKTAIRSGCRTDSPCEGVRLPKSDSTADVFTLLMPAEYRILDEAGSGAARVEMRSERSTRLHRPAQDAALTTNCLTTGEPGHYLARACRRPDRPRSRFSSSTRGGSGSVTAPSGRRTG